MSPYERQKRKETAALVKATGSLQLKQHINNMKMLVAALGECANIQKKRQCTTPEEQPGKCESQKGCVSCDSYQLKNPKYALETLRK